MRLGLRVNCVSAQRFLKVAQILYRNIDGYVESARQFVNDGLVVDALSQKFVNGGAGSVEREKLSAIDVHDDRAIRRVKSTNPVPLVGHQMPPVQWLLEGWFEGNLTEEP